MKKIGLIFISMVMLCAFSNSPCKTELIKGTWISKSNKKQQLIITNKYVIHTQKGSANDTNYYQLTSLYGTDVSGQNCYLITKNKNEEYEMAYQILSAADEGLNLMDLSKGDFLSFKRQK
jgi:hypothetical protein